MLPILGHSRKPSGEMACRLTMSVAGLESGPVKQGRQPFPVTEGSMRRHQGAYSRNGHVNRAPVSPPAVDAGADPTYDFVIVAFYVALLKVKA